MSKTVNPTITVKGFDKMSVLLMNETIKQKIAHAMQQSIDKALHEAMGMPFEPSEFVFHPGPDVIDIKANCAIVTNLLEDGKS